MTKNIVITGANRGIGLALAAIYSQRGEKVFAVCRNSSVALEALVGIELLDGVDVTESSGLSKIDGLIGYHSIDILVHNAGILIEDSLESFQALDVIEQFNVNALAPIKLTQLLKNRLVRGGKIALITSRMGSIQDNTSGGFYGYRMSKAALNAAGKSLAVDLKGSEVSVGLIHPGFVQTELVGFKGDVSPNESALNIVRQIDELSIETSGSFKHASGLELPW